MFRTFINRIEEAIENEECIILQIENKKGHIRLRMSMQLDSCGCTVTEIGNGADLYLTDGFTEFYLTVDDLVEQDGDGFIINKLQTGETIIDFIS